MSRTKRERVEAVDVHSAPDRFAPDTRCILSVPLGEVCDLAFPLGLLGLSGDAASRAIIEADRFNAQGLEGAADIGCTWSHAYILCSRIPEHRGYLTVNVQ